MSGSPRSRMTRSGCLSVTLLSASAPVSASSTTKPSSSRPARRKRRICTSSSTTRTTGGESVIRDSLWLVYVRIIRQKEGNGRPLIGAGAVGLQPAAIGADESLGDPQAEARAGRGPGKAMPAEEALAKLGHLVFGETGSAVVNRQHDIMSVPFCTDVDRRSAWRVFGSIVYDLHERLLDQNRVDIDERKVRVH